MISSTLYTIGTALMRAKDAEVTVELLVTGHWLHGFVSAVDGHGVMLIGDNDELSVVRIDEIAAVKVLRGSAFSDRPTVEQHHEVYDVHPMPAATGDR